MIEYIFKVREFHMIFTFYSLLQLCPPLRINCCFSQVIYKGQNLAYCKPDLVESSSNWVGRKVVRTEGSTHIAWYKYNTGTEHAKGKNTNHHKARL